MFIIPKYSVKYLPALLLFLLSLPQTLFAQHAKEFTLVIKAPNTLQQQIHAGEAYFFEHYMSAKFSSDSASNSNGEYRFYGKILYPTAIRIFSRDAGIAFNKLLFIEPGYQEFEIKVEDSAVLLQRSLAKIEREYKDFLNFMNASDLDQELSMPLLQKYIQRKPDSYIALFALIDQTFNFDFRPEIRQLVKLLDTSILKTKGFQSYEREYLIEKKIPAVVVKNANDKNVQLNFKRSDGKYTFIEFWFYGCQGCIPVMKEIKEKYYATLSNRIRMISISTDSKKNVVHSIKLLKQLQLPWETYWDYNEKEFSKHTLLYAYPGNILIDPRGYIVAKNINITTLGSYLDKNDNSINNR
jgi:peroxiredoxin